MVAACDPFLWPWHMHNMKESRAMEGTNGAYGLHTGIPVDYAAIEVLEYTRRGVQIPTAIVDRPCKAPETLPIKKFPLHESSGCNTCRQRCMHAKKCNSEGSSNAHLMKQFEVARSKQRVFQPSMQRSSLHHIITSTHELWRAIGCLYEKHCEEFMLHSIIDQLSILFCQ